MQNTATRVLVFYDKPQELLPELQRQCPEAHFFTCQRYDDVSAVIRDTRPEVALAYKFEPRPFPREAFVTSNDLKWLSVAFAGVDHVVPWDDEKLIVTNASGVAAQEMAQYAIAGIFGLFQRLPYFAKRQAEHHWDYQLVRSATGACVGLIGLGHSGKAIAKMCSQLGLRTLAYRSQAEPCDFVERVFIGDQLSHMLEQCDVVLICAALTPATKGMVDEKVLAAMKPGAYLINMARGAIVNEIALIAALKSGHLGGAVIDVANNEPLQHDNPLWDTPNLLITPHTSSEYEGWQNRAAEMFSQNLLRWQRGEALANRVWSDRGY